MVPLQPSTCEWFRTNKNGRRLMYIDVDWCDVLCCDVLSVVFRKVDIFSHVKLQMHVRTYGEPSTCIDRKRWATVLYVTAIHTLKLMIYRKLVNCLLVLNCTGTCYMHLDTMVL